MREGSRVKKPIIAAAMLTLVVLVAVAGPSPGNLRFRAMQEAIAQPSPTAADRDQILKILDQLADAGLRRDVSAMQPLYDPEYFHTNPDGSVMTLSEVYKSYQEPTIFHFDSQKTEERRMIVRPPLAVVNQVTVLHGTKEGAGPFTSRYRVTYVLRQRDGHWTVLNSHSSLLGITPGS